MERRREIIALHRVRDVNGRSMLTGDDGPTGILSHQTFPLFLFLFHFLTFSRSGRDPGHPRLGLISAHSKYF